MRTGSPFAGAADVEMAKRNHRDVTTRHVLATWVRSYEGILRKRGEPGLGDVGARLDELLDREPRRTGSTVLFAPRLVGALAAAIATSASQPDMPLPATLLLECLAGDDAVEFVREALRDGIQRSAAAAAGDVATHEGDEGGEAREARPPADPIG
jgi:hypothetical protein